MAHNIRHLSPNIDSASRPVLDPQHQSYLLSLPYELRQQIYIDVLGGSNQPFHILRTKERLTCVRCRMPHEPEAQRHGCLGSLESTEDFMAYFRFTEDVDVRKPDDVPMGIKGMLELLRTCRLIYAEGIRLLYSAPCFLVDSIDTLLVWKGKVLPSRFNDIRALDLKYGLKCGRYGARLFHFTGFTWRAHWEMVGEMKALKHLRVRLRIMNPADYPHPNSSPANERELLMPLENVTGPQDFVVIVSWAVECDEDGREADHGRKRSFRLLSTVGDNKILN